MNQTQTERALAGVGMGDDDAIRAIATRLDMATPEVIAQMAADRLRFQAAAQQFQKNYNDVWSDEVLRKVAISRDLELAGTEPQLSYEARLEKVGSELRDWVKRQTASKEATPASEPAPRPRRVTARPVVDHDDVDSPAEESATDRSRLINSMAQSRGQRSAVWHPFHETDVAPYAIGGDE